MTHLKLYRPPTEMDPFATLLTPSRDVWRCKVMAEIERLLERPDLTRTDLVVELADIVERHQGTKVAEER